MITRPHYGAWLSPRLDVFAARHVAADLLCGVACLALALHAATLCAETAIVRVVDADSNPVADAAVFLTRDPVGESPASESTRSAVIDQIGYQFVPRVLIVRTGTDVAFPNSDNVRHHVYSFSEAKRFELPLYAGDSHPSVRFDRAGLVTLGCNIHDDMVGYVLAVDTPYFGKTDANGRVVLEGLPAGRYDVGIWSSRQRDTTTVQHAALALGSGEPAGNLAVSITARLRPPPPERHAGSLWKGY